MNRLFQRSLGGAMNENLVESRDEKHPPLTPSARFASQVDQNVNQSPDFFELVSKWSGAHKRTRTITSYGHSYCRSVGTLAHEQRQLICVLFSSSPKCETGGIVATTANLMNTRFCYRRSSGQLSRVDFFANAGPQIQWLACQNRRCS